MSKPVIKVDFYIQCGVIKKREDGGGGLRAVIKIGTSCNVKFDTDEGGKGRTNRERKIKENHPPNPQSKAINTN